MTKPTATRPHVLSISQLNQQARQLLEGHFALVWVEGELSNFTRPSSGHWYFSLKDDDAQVRCAMFRGNNIRVRQVPASGSHVLVRARVSLFEPRGDYQLIVEHMEPAGQGLMALAFAALKQKLEAEGLFAPERKKPLPELVRHIAVVTSPTGAAIRDIVSVLRRRSPGIRITVLPVAVQGDGAARQIADAVTLANALAERGDLDFDLILVGRGGGSAEDLWAFNEEIVARAICASQLPVVSAVGHETDFTIADLVADVRAPTPSAAAEMVSPDRREQLAALNQYCQLLTRAMQKQLQQQRQHLGWLRARLRHPGARLRDQQQRLDHFELRLHRALRQQMDAQAEDLQQLRARLQRAHPARPIAAQRATLASLQARLHQAMRSTLRQQQARLQGAAQQLHSLSPLSTLQRGYAIVALPGPGKSEALVHTVAQLKKGVRIRGRLADGEFRAIVEECQPRDVSH